MRIVYAAMEAAWKALRGPLVSILGEERLGALLDGVGLRSYKTKNFQLETKVRDGSALVYRPHDLCIVEEVFDQAAALGSFLAGWSIRIPVSLASRQPRRGSNGGRSNGAAS